jgi:transcriptional regulator with XRE-family HTH domain
MTNIREALRMTQRLGKISPDDSVSRAIEKVQRLLTAVPMQTVLDQVRPGEPVAAKAKAVGVSRQTFYYWLNGTTRPNKKQAKRLASMTGFTIDEIRGHVV